MVNATPDDDIPFERFAEGVTVYRVHMHPYPIGEHDIGWDWVPEDEPIGPGEAIQAGEAICIAVETEE